MGAWVASPNEAKHIVVMRKLVKHGVSCSAGGMRALPVLAIPTRLTK